MDKKIDFEKLENSIKLHRNSSGKLKVINNRYMFIDTEEGKTLEIKPIKSKINTNVNIKNVCTYKYFKGDINSKCLASVMYFKFDDAIVLSYEEKSDEYKFSVNVNSKSITYKVSNAYQLKIYFTEFVNEKAHAFRRGMKVNNFFIGYLFFSFQLV